MSVCIGIVITMLLSQCTSPNIQPTPYTLQIKEGWKTPVIPENNPLTEESIALGRALFFDNTLSVDSSISCSSCHLAQKGFADNPSLSFGVEQRLGFRNSSTLTNVAFLPYFNRDGGVKTLDIFPSVPIEDHQEMGFNLLLAGKRVAQNPAYVKAAKTAYGRKMDGFVITRSIASYLRTFISDNSLYDQYLMDSSQVKLTPSQSRGKHLFFSDKANCSKCHSGVQFTDYTFQNNGLYASYETRDRGRERLTFDPADAGKFRVATLRNIELTSPYMHDGSLNTLEDVLNHYANNGADHKNEHPLIDQISLTEEDQKDIIAFLKTLTDYDFINNPSFTKPSVN